jgi:hypothetical protein
MAFLELLDGEGQSVNQEEPERSNSNVFVRTVPGRYIVMFRSGNAREEVRSSKSNRYGILYAEDEP